MDDRIVSDITAKVLDAARMSGGEATFSADIAHWEEDKVRSWVDLISSQAKSYNLRVKGIRTDTFGFRKLSIDQDVSNGGRYKGIPVVISDVAFDTIEFVFVPAK